MPNLRQQTRRSAVWADLMKHFTSSSRKWTIICTSNLQVKFTTLQVSQCSYKCSFCLTVILTVELQNLDSSFQALSNYYKLCLFLKAYCLLQPFYVLHQLFSLVLNRILLSRLAQQNLVLDQFFLSFLIRTKLQLQCLLKLGQKLWPKYGLNQPFLQKGVNYLLRPKLD